MTIYNGFHPGEVRVHTRRPRKVDQGHTLVEAITARQGDTDRFRHTIVCQCGRRFSGRIPQRPLYAYAAHCQENRVDERPPLAEVVARAQNRSDTDPTWRVDYSKE